MEPRCQRLAAGILLALGLLQHAYATEASTLTPFVGETAREFEARKRGVPFTNPNGRSGVFTVAPDERGHYFVESVLDGQRIRMLVDTGASLVALSHEDGKALSLPVTPRDYTYKIATANGVIAAAPVRIHEIQVGDIIVRNVEAVVLPPGR